MGHYINLNTNLWTTESSTGILKGFEENFAGRDVEVVFTV